MLEQIRGHDGVARAAAAYRWREWRHTLKPGGAFVTTLPTKAFFVDKASAC